MIKCYIFDLDGVLLFTGRANQEAYRLAFSELSLKWDEAIFENSKGMRLDQLLANMEIEADSKLLNQLMDLKASFYQKNFDLIEVNTPVVELLRSVRQHSKTCLSTSASRRNALNVLKHFKLDDLFDCCFFAEDVANPKPDPEGFLNCMEKVGVSAQESLIFEDSPVGLEAAKRSGAKFIKIVLS